MCGPGLQPQGTMPRLGTAPFGRGRRVGASRRPWRVGTRLVPLLVAALALVGGQLGAPRASAQGGIGFSPAALDFGELGAGGEALATLSLDSSFEDVTVLDLEIVGVDASWFSVHANEPAALADEPPMTEVSVVPEGPRRIVVRVRVPDDAPPGDRAAGLRLEQRSTGDTNDIDVGVEVPLRVSVAGEAMLSGEVVDVEIPAIEPGRPIEVRARIRNTGTTVLPVEAEISAVIAGASGTGQRYGTETVAPGTDKILVYTLDAIPPAGTHAVEATFRSGSEVLGSIVGEVVVGEVGAETSGAPPLSGDRQRGRVVWPVFAFGLVAVIAGLVLAERTGRPEATHAVSRRLKGGKPKRGRHHADPGTDGWSPQGG